MKKDSTSWYRVLSIGTLSGQYRTRVGSNCDLTTCLVRQRSLFALFTGHERAPSLACAPAAVEEKEEEKQGGAAGPAAARAPVTPREEQVGSRFVSGRVYGADRPETGS